MPNYELKCTACEHRFEFLKIRRDEKIPNKCPKCGKKKVEKIFSQKTSFVLKGGGWYKDGY